MQVVEQSCDCYIDDNGIHTYVEEKWENERWTPITQKWKEPTVIIPTDPKRWTDAKRDRPRVDIGLPEHWKWRHDWHVAISQTTDDSGWMYGKMWTQSLHQSQGMFDCVRSRKWQRTRLYEGSEGMCQKWKKSRSRDKRSSENREIIREGWLEKRGDDILRQYKKRYFILTSDNQIFYYGTDPKKAKKQIQPKGVIQLVSINSIEEHDGKDFGFKLRADNRSYVLSSQYAGGRRGWIQEIERRIGINPLTSKDIHDSLSDFTPERTQSRGRSRASALSSDSGVPNSPINSSLGNSVSDNFSPIRSPMRTTTSTSSTIDDILESSNSESKHWRDDSPPKKKILISSSSTNGDMAVPSSSRQEKKRSKDFFVVDSEKEKTDDEQWLQKAEELGKIETKRIEEERRKQILEDEKREKDKEERERAALRQKELSELESQEKNREMQQFPQVADEIDVDRTESDNRILLNTTTQKKGSKWRYLCSCFPRKNLKPEPINL